MAVTITIGNTVATINNGVWQCNDNTYEFLLNEKTKFWNDELGNYQPNPDLSIAQKAANFSGGKVVHSSPVIYKNELIY